MDRLNPEEIDSALMETSIPLESQFAIMDRLFSQRENEEKVESNGRF